MKYFKLSKLFNENWKENDGEMTQEELGKFYGFKRSTVSLILPIYPRLKETESANILAFKNMDLISLATIKNDFLRYLLVEKIMESRKSKKKAKERQKEAGKKYGVSKSKKPREGERKAYQKLKKREKLVLKSEQPILKPEGKSIEIAARKAGLKKDTYHKAKKIIKAKEEGKVDEKTYEKLKKGERDKKLKWFLNKCTCARRNLS